MDPTRVEIGTTHVNVRVQFREAGVTGSSHGEYVPPSGGALNSTMEVVPARTAVARTRNDTVSPGAAEMLNPSKGLFTASRLGTRGTMSVVCTTTLKIISVTA